MLEHRVRPAAAGASVGEDLGPMFAAAAAGQFRGFSPRYETLAQAVAQQPSLAEPLLAAPAHRRAPSLLFAAVQLVLRGNAKGHELAAYLPTLSGYRTPDDAMVGAFAALVREHHAELSQLCATRLLQTNEPRRGAALLPAFALAGQQFPGRGLGLVELGASAGLLLVDAYAYRYRDGPTTRDIGRPDVTGPLILECLLRGEERPDLPGAPPAIAGRIGVDLAPLDPRAPETKLWLASCVWPEHVLRLGRLARALAYAREHPPTLVAGDMVDALPDLVRRFGAGVVPCVFASSSVCWLPAERRGALRRAIEALGRQRDLVAIFDEPPEAGYGLFTTEQPPPPPGEAAEHGSAVGLLTMVTFARGVPAVRALGWSGPHGAWLAWRPREAAYAPWEGMDG